MLALFFGKKALSFLSQIFCTSLCCKSSIFLSSFYSTCSQKQFSLSKNVLGKLNQATMWYCLWKGVCHIRFPYNPFLFEQCIVQILTLIPIIPKLLVLSFETTLGFILILRHNFHTVLGDSLTFLPCPGKFCHVILSSRHNGLYQRSRDS